MSSVKRSSVEQEVMIARSADGRSAATWSALKPPQLLPNIPTAPVHQGWAAIQAMQSAPSWSSCARYSPDEPSNRCCPPMSTRTLRIPVCRERAVDGLIAQGRQVPRAVGDELEQGRHRLFLPTPTRQPRDPPAASCRHRDPERGDLDHVSAADGIARLAHRRSIAEHPAARARSPRRGRPGTASWEDPTPHEESTAVIVIENVRLIDGIADHAMTAMDVTIDGERITTVRPHVPGAAPMFQEGTVIDGAGKTLLPGFVDCHSHYPIDPLVEDASVLTAEPGAASRRTQPCRPGAGATCAAAASLQPDVVLWTRSPPETPGPRLLAADRADITGGRLDARAGGDGERSGARTTSATALTTSRRSPVRRPCSRPPWWRRAHAGGAGGFAEAARLRAVMAHAQGSQSVMNAARGRGERGARLPRG
jgi:hypothetical protein